MAFRITAHKIAWLLCFIWLLAEQIVSAKYETMLGLQHSLACLVLLVASVYLIWFYNDSNVPRYQASSIISAIVPHPHYFSYDERVLLTAGVTFIVALVVRVAAYIFTQPPSFVAITLPCAGAFYMTLSMLFFLNFPFSPPSVHDSNGKWLKLAWFLNGPRNLYHVCPESSVDGRCDHYLTVHDHSKELVHFNQTRSFLYEYILIRSNPMSSSDKTQITIGQVAEIVKGRIGSNDFHR